MRLDGKTFLVSLSLSLLFHFFVFGLIFYFKGLFFFKRKAISLNFYEISIVGSISPPKVVKRRIVSKRKTVKSKSSKIKRTKRRVKTAKKEILVSKRKSKKVVKKRSSVRKENLDEKLLRERLKELEEEKYLEKRLAQLKAASQKKESYVSESRGTGIKIKGKAEVDPLLAFYIAKLVERIRMNWILPEVKKGLEAIVDVKMDKKGRAVKISFEKRSGDIVFDESCLRAVKKSFPFEPLPFTYNQEYLEIGVRFKP